MNNNKNQIIDNVKINRIIKEIETANDIIMQTKDDIRNNLRDILHDVSEECFEQFYIKVLKLINHEKIEQNNQDELDKVFDKYFITIDNK